MGVDQAGGSDLVLAVDNLVGSTEWRGLGRLHGHNFAVVDGNVGGIDFAGNYIGTAHMSDQRIDGVSAQGRGDYRHGFL